MTVPAGPKIDALTNLRQSTSRLCLTALRLGADSAEILDSVGQAIDQAAQIRQSEQKRLGLVITFRKAGAL